MLMHVWRLSQPITDCYFPVWCLTFGQLLEVLLYLHDALSANFEDLVAHPPLALLTIHLHPVGMLIRVVFTHCIDLPLPCCQFDHEDLAAVMEGQQSGSRHSTSLSLIHAINSLWPSYQLWFIGRSLICETIQCSMLSTSKLYMTHLSFEVSSN